MMDTAADTAADTRTGAAMAGALMEGKVKWFNDAKGYGFIELEGGRDVFVHYSVIESDGYRSLREGQQVAFALERGPKGEHAVRVVPPAA